MNYKNKLLISLTVNIVFATIYLIFVIIAFILVGTNLLNT